MLFFAQKSSPFSLLHKHRFLFPSGNTTYSSPYLFPNCRYRFRCLLFDHIAPKFAVSSSLNSVFTTANLIAAAAAAAAGSGTVHSAVSSTITHVAVTAVAIASGACLSTKVDFLWPKVEEQPGSLILDGVDVTGCPIFTEPKVYHLNLRMMSKNCLFGKVISCH